MVNYWQFPMIHPKDDKHMCYKIGQNGNVMEGFLEKVNLS